MKLNKIVCSLSVRPAFPCGAETALMLGTTAVLGMMGTMESNNSNRSINESNQKFSAEEAEKQRQFQKDEWTRQYGIQRDEWYNQLHALSNEQWQQYLRQADYNSPKNQIGRMNEAGINPSAVLGGSGSSGLVSAATGNISSVGSPAPPSGGSVSGASAAAPSQIPMQSIFGNLLPNVGTFLRDMASASKDNSITPAMVKLLGSQFVGQELKNGWQQIDNEILSKIKDIKVKQAFQDLENAFCQEALYKAMGKNYDADTLVKKAEEALKQAQKTLTDEEYNQLVFIVQHQFETWSAQQNVMRSEANKNNADAGFSVAKTKTEDENRQNVVNLTKFQSEWQDTQNKLADIDYKIKAGTYDEQLTLACRKLVEEAKREQLLTSRAAAEAEKAIKENDWWLYMHIVQPAIQMVSEKHSEMMNLGTNVLKFLR